MTLHRCSNRLLLPLLVIAVTSAIAGPACSQVNSFFARTPQASSEAPYQMMIGSGPSPTPGDLCMAGSTAEHCYTDATKTKRKIFVPDFNSPYPHYREYRPGDEKLIEDQIKARKQVAREHFRVGGGVQ